MKSIRGVASKKELPIILTVLVLLFAVGWYGRHHQQQQKTKEQAASTPSPGWTTYQSQQYGFKFNYPKIWGPANVTEIHEQTGKSFTISFNFNSEKSSKSDYGDVFQIKMDSNDASTKFCNVSNKNQCTTTTAFTQADIKKTLSNNKQGLAKYDDSSYAIYQYYSYSTLEVNQIIKLPQLKVTAARANFQRYSPVMGCSMDKLEANAKAGCLGLPEYNDIKMVLNSLEPR